MVEAQSRPSLLLVLPWSPLLAGGVSVVVRKLAEHLQDGPLRPVIVVSDWSASAVRQVGDDYLSFRFAALHGTRPLDLLKSVALLPLRLLRTRRLLRSQRAAAVNFHYPSLDVLPVALLKRMGLFSGRIVLSFHGTDARPPATAVERLLWRTTLSQVDGYTACSHALAAAVASAIGVDVGRITVAYNGVDAHRFMPEAASLPVGTAGVPPRYVISVGSYIPRKGHRTLVDAFASIADAYPGLDLVIAGMDGSERAAVESQIHAHGLDGRVYCLVDVDHRIVPALLARADLCVQPSFAEPFGLAVIEAGACGVPVIATAVGGHLELVHDGRTGRLFAPGDVAGCADAMRQLLDDPRQRAQMAIQFRDEVTRRYTWGNCAATYQRLAVGEAAG